MNNNIPYIAYEEAMVRHERTQKRLVIALCLSLMVNGLMIAISRY